MLGFQAQTGAILVNGSSFALLSAIEKISGVKLKTGL